MIVGRASGGQSKKRLALVTAGVAAFSGISACGISACGVPRPGISSGSVSACYRAIPAARTAVHTSPAHMIGLHRLPANEVEARLHPGVYTTLPDHDTIVCAVVFEGRFAPGQVAMAPPAEQGHYAVVLVTSKQLQLVAAYVVDRLPKDLGRRVL